LVLSGLGAVVAEARPGETLYGLHAMFFDEPRVNEDQITLSAKADLLRVQQMIDHGQWDQAQNQLAEVSTMVQSMNDGGRRQDLMDEVNLLNTRVESRDPNATLPPNSPPSPKGSVIPVPKTKPPTAPAPTSTPAASTTTPPVSPTPTTKPPTAASTTAPAPTPSVSPSPSPSPSPAKHHHHDQTPTPSS
jgi:hypothetical protein